MFLWLIIICKLAVDWQVLQEVEYKAWLTEHAFAETSIENRDELLLQSAQRLETNLTLLGETRVITDFLNLFLISV